VKWDEAILFVNEIKNLAKKTQEVTLQRQNMGDNNQKIMDKKRT
jgi:hypothetical protein